MPLRNRQREVRPRRKLLVRTNLQRASCPWFAVHTTTRRGPSVTRAGARVSRRPRRRTGAARLRYDRPTGRLRPTSGVTAADARDAPSGLRHRSDGECAAPAVDGHPRRRRGLLGPRDPGRRPPRPGAPGRHRARHRRAAGVRAVDRFRVRGRAARDRTSDVREPARVADRGDRGPRLRHQHAGRHRRTSSTRRLAPLSPASTSVSTPWVSPCGRTVSRSGPPTTSRIRSA